MSQPKIPSIRMPGMSRLQMPEPLINVTLNPEIFEQLIKGQGVRMIHSRPVPCPNLREIGAGHNPSCTRCYNGFIYYNPVEFIGALSNNTMDRKFNMNGTWDLDQAQIIIPVKDNGGSILDVQFFDQILLPDAAPVRYYQLVEHSQSGIDRLQFPAVSVDFVIDAHGKKYRPGIDVVVEEGRLRWIGERPGFNAQLGRGVIYSVNYYVRPCFTILGIPHQIRVAQTQSPDGPGSKNVQARFPMLCVVRRDFIPYDSADSVGQKDRPDPPKGSFR
jgi:hypothetical protein